MKDCKLIGVHNHIQYLVRESDGVDFYYSPKTGMTAMSLSGISRMLECTPKSIHKKSLELNVTKTAELLTTQGIQLLKIVWQEDLITLLKSVVNSKMKIETKEKASEILFKDHNIFYLVKKKTVSSKQSIEKRCRESYKKMLKEEDPCIDFIEEYQTEAGRCDLYFKDSGYESIVEIKSIYNWKHALGQVLSYTFGSKDYIKNVVLITDKFDFNQLLLIDRVFSSHKIVVTLWNPNKPKDFILLRHYMENQKYSAPPF